MNKYSSIQISLNSTSIAASKSVQLTSPSLFVSIYNKMMMMIIGMKKNKTSLPSVFVKNCWSFFVADWGILSRGIVRILNRNEINLKLIIKRCLFLIISTTAQFLSFCFYREYSRRILRISSHGHLISSNLHIWYFKIFSFVT